VIGSLPIRVRLALPFALAMALVLAGTGAFVYVRVGSTLLRSVDQGLRGQATEALTRLDDERPLLDGDALDSAGIAEVQTVRGEIVESSPAGLPPLLTGSGLVRAATKPLFVSKTVSGLKGTWRIRAIPVSGGRIVIVGRSLDSRDESLDRLRHEFLFAAPLALLLATLAGYLLAGAALRPVEAMRRRAAAISASTPGTRLPVPQSNDEISRLAETLNEMLERLEAAFQHERRFVSDASHELRTPLALLRTELELALRRPRSREELEQALRSAAEETERLSQLAEDLLLIARSDQGSLPIRGKRISAQELLAEVADRFASRAAQLGRTVSVEYGEDATLDADPMRLEQAIGNLVDNALTHGRGPVRLSVVRHSERVELHVIDEGDGFTPEFAERAFDRFSRADDARGAGGTGLGLAIVELIASAHGGSAGVAQRDGGGADVWIALQPAPDFAAVALVPR